MSIHENFFILCLLMAFGMGVGLAGFTVRKSIPRVLCLVLNEYRLQRMKHPTALAVIMNNMLVSRQSKFVLEYNADKQLFELKKVKP